MGSHDTWLARFDDCQSVRVDSAILVHRIQADLQQLFIESSIFPFGSLVHERQVGSIAYILKEVSLLPELSTPWVCVLVSFLLL